MAEAQEIHGKIKTRESEFIDHWKTIDIIKQFGPDQLEGALDQPVRKAIISILSEGREIEDEEGNTHVLRVYNASQLLDRINAIAEEKNKFGLEKIKRSNLYYHLNALEERGFITEVGLIPKKNRLISYYGRTARVFLLNYDHEKGSSVFEDEALPSLIQSINPEVSDDELESIIEGLKLMHRKVDTDPIHQWVEQNEKTLRQSDVDIRQLHNIFYKILMFDEKTISAMQKFADVMKLDRN